ncbi:Uncharacterised protein at_DN0288 [Pycnogonum litorale]
MSSPDLNHHQLRGSKKSILKKNDSGELSNNDDLEKLIQADSSSDDSSRRQLPAKQMRPNNDGEISVFIPLVADEENGTTLQCPNAGCNHNRLSTYSAGSPLCTCGKIMRENSENV